jgi:hypothetical protein
MYRARYLHLHFHSEPAIPELQEQLQAATPEGGNDEIQGDILLKFSTPMQDPGFVDKSTNQLVLSHSSDIKPRPIRNQKIIHTNYNWSTLCTRYIPHPELYGILSAHAYNLFKVPNLIANKLGSALVNSKTYQCPCSNFQIRVIQVCDDATGDNRKWKIDPNYMQPGEAVVTGACTFLYQSGKKTRTMRATATVKTTTTH